MPSKDDFIRRWKLPVAGMALFGVASEVKDGPLTRAGKVLDIPEQVESLLAEMYAFLTHEEPAKGEPLPVKRNGASNGTANGGSNGRSHY